MSSTSSLASLSDSDVSAATKRRRLGSDKTSESCKLEQRRIANRKASVACRMRKKIFINELQRQVHELAQKNSKYEEENQILRKMLEFKRSVQTLPSFDNDHVAVGGNFPSPYTSTSISSEEVLPTTQLSMPMNTFTQRNAQSTGNFVPLEPLKAKTCFQDAPSSFTAISSSPPNGHRTDDERDQIYERLARVAVEKFVAMKKA
mmetsp:Transcript_5361/g.7221  ORF Transcript_5361/g.7221 Transcript_5361/m.7221 type:complete len:204 (+) Transcript_5361:126-737(+)|eukprot:CAMPEP_0116062552 /NCGR_PEP_ID=MMETSP0322-20121206/7833_1 /TAXON_ID=163516 /ORGANISM="Leptocylindrus danicus var. apora, Strain B651" /LENGTH=203 /DNA_ID=CAMNT_0003547893 /DNA_START=72 /DNA_END=683 /DNA_ORIENTATION=-